MRIHDMIIGLFDIEAENYKSFGWEKVSNPHDSRNFIVCYCLKQIYEGMESTNTHYYTESDFELNLRQKVEKCDLLVCHNVKFDILFLYIRYEWFRRWIWKGGRIWCTMIAEYIISGQTRPMFSLDKSSAKYGGTQKSLHLSDYYNQGKMTSDIDKDTLLKYNTYDVLNTEIVFKAQLQKLEERNQIPLMEAQMESILYYIECETNGVYIDRKICKTEATLCQEKIIQLENEILDSVDALIGFSSEECRAIPRSYWNLASTLDRSVIFFGGNVTLEETRQLKDDKGMFVRIKSRSSPNYGVIKTEKVKKEVYFEGLGLTPIKKLAREGYYSTEKDVIHKLALQGVEMAQIFEKLSYFVTMRNKYYNGLPNLTYEKDGCVHQSFKIATATGRGSCVNPNMQNIPRKGEVKKVFTSRFGKKGVIIQFDQGQLEVRVLAFLSQCTVLKRVISSGIDMHALSVRAWKKREDFTKEERNLAKVMTFQLAYGAGYIKMSLTLEIPEEEAKEFIKGFYDTYPGVKNWHYSLIKEVNSNRQGKYSTLRNPSGRLLVFKESYYERTGEWTFKPTQCKNYPVQSLAADILIVQMGEIFRKILPYRGKCYMINTVHDSIILDCKKEVSKEIIPIVKGIMEDTNLISKLINENFNVPLKVDVSVGPSWYNQENINVI